jgi:hypothetical protein
MKESVCPKCGDRFSLVRGVNCKGYGHDPDSENCRLRWLVNWWREVCSTALLELDTSVCECGFELGATDSAQRLREALLVDGKHKEEIDDSTS